MRKWFRKAKLSQQLSVINCLCILIPTLFLWYSMLSSMQDTAIRTKEQEAALMRSQLVTQVERMSEVCNLSTQVFMNTPNLIGHLTELKKGTQLDTLELLDFYREDIASLEKIVISNPELYQIRVYSVVENMNEMMPILYSADRLARMPWAEQEQSSGVWYLNYTDCMLADTAGTDHIMSLVTPIEVGQEGLVGVLEVSARMDEVMPEFFAEGSSSYSVLLSEDGGLIAGISPVETALLDAIPFSENIEVQRLGGSRVLVTQAMLKEFGCRYIQVTSLSDLDRAMTGEAIVMLVVLLAAFALMVFAVSRLTRRMLRGFYGAFDGIRAFADGDVDATVEVTGEGEVAMFAREAGGLLDKIRQLMQDNLEQERQAQSLKIRALQNQINAHFIYNVLEAIKMMAEIDEKYEIADAVTSLGNLLRYSMKWVSGNVLLRREMEYIENYITLMNLRFDYEIRLQAEVPEELMVQRVPKISLQPIVENAVIHGAAILASDTTISVKGITEKEKGRFSILITDEGRGMDEEMLLHLRRQISGQEPTRSTSGNGIGLNNVQSRVQSSFGEEYGLTVESRPGQGTTVILTLPYEAQEGENT